MRTATEILKATLDGAQGDVKAAREALEDGAYLADAGYTDADTEAVEQVHGLLGAVERASELKARAQEKVHEAHKARAALTADTWRDGIVGAIVAISEAEQEEADAGLAYAAATTQMVSVGGLSWADIERLHI